MDESGAKTDERIHPRLFYVLLTVAAACFGVGAGLDFWAEHVQGAPKARLDAWTQWLSAAFVLFLAAAYVVSWRNTYRASEYRGMRSAMRTVWIGYAALSVLFLIGGLLMQDEPRRALLTVAVLCLSQAVMSLIAYRKMGSAHRQRRRYLDLRRKWLFYLVAFWAYPLFAVASSLWLMPQVSDSMADTWIGLLIFTQAYDLIVKDTPENGPDGDAAAQRDGQAVGDEADVIMAPEEAHGNMERSGPSRLAEMNRLHRRRRLLRRMR